MLGCKDFHITHDSVLWLFNLCHLSNTGQFVWIAPVWFWSQPFLHGFAEKLNYYSEKFDAKLFLSRVHLDTSAADLESGAFSLKNELKGRTQQRKQLVKENFDCFVSCKTTIDGQLVWCLGLQQRTLWTSNMLVVVQILNLSWNGLRKILKVLEQLTCSIVSKESVHLLIVLLDLYLRDR